MITSRTRIIGDPEDYVVVLRDLERSTPGPVHFASSFLSSIYFPASALQRFYSGSHGEHSRACAVLLERRDVAVQRRSVVARRELYEASAFRNMMAQGLVHEQELNYRVRPGELQHALETMLEWIGSGAALEIAITTEILPLVFTLAAPGDILIDIRANYLYQRIQGIHIHGDTQAFEHLLNDFERLWTSAAVKGDAVINLIARALEQWQSGREVDFAKWPHMQTSERR